MSEKRLAACGLDCTKCDQYKLPTDKEVQDRMIPFFRERGWIKEDEGLETILEKKMYCKGCGNQDAWWSDGCKIEKCCRQDKKHHNCFECGEFVCDQLKEWSEGNDRYGEAVEYLKQQK